MYHACIISRTPEEPVVPDNSLPESPVEPDNSLPESPVEPDNSLPESPVEPDNTLPEEPVEPDNSLPPVINPPVQMTPLDNVAQVLDAQIAELRKNVMAQVQLALMSSK